MKDASAGGSSEVDLGRYLNPEITAAIARLDLQALAIVEGFMAGRHRSPFHGFSTSFSEHRRYEENDPVKDIDWKVYARTEKHFVRKYEAETTLECMLMVDVSSSMAWRAPGANVGKLDYAIMLAAAMGLLLQRQQDQMGLVAFDDGIRSWLKPGSRRNHLMSLLSTVIGASTGRPTSFAKTLPEAAGMIRHRGLVILLTDFLGDGDAAIDALATLRARKHEVLVFHLMDKAEIELPWDFLCEFEDPEKLGEKLTLHPDSVRAAYRQELDAFCAKIDERCAANRIGLCRISTADPFDKALREFIIKRSKS